MEWLIVALLVINLAVVAYFDRNAQKKAEKPQDLESMDLLQQQMQDLSRSVENKHGEGTNRMFESMRAQFGESQRLASDIRDLVAKQLTEVRGEQTKTNESTTRFMVIAEQLANLEKVLKHQKQRGNLVEASLELILSNILPPGSYKMQ